MSEQELGENSWEDAVSSASQHVVERAQAKEEAILRQKPKARGPKLAAAVLVLLGVAVWNVMVLTRSPEPVPAPEEQSSLIWFVADAAEVVEDFLIDEGRLPTAAEAVELLDDDVVYVATGEGYAITIDGELTRVEYDSSENLDDWLALQMSTRAEVTR